MLPGTRRALHGHLPDDEPSGRQRDAARRTVRQRRSGRPPGRLRPHAVRLHGPGRRPPDGHRSARPATVGLRRRAARLRGRGVPPDRRRAVDAMAGRAGPRPPRLRARAAHRAQPSGRALAVGVPDRPPRSTGWIVRTSRGSPTPPTCVRTRPTPPPATGPAPTTPPTCRHPIAVGERSPRHCIGRCWATPSRLLRPTRRRWRASRRSTTACAARSTTNSDGCGRRCEPPASGSDTIVVVTADHGEQLGDQGLIQKAGFFESSYRIPGIVRDPRRPATAGTVVEEFTENVDVFPTICSPARRWTCPGSATAIR